MTAFERKFPPDPTELAPARAALRAWLHDVGVDGEDATAKVLVVASELVTNGVFHDGGDLITLRADRQDWDVSIAVTTVDHLPGRRPTYRDVEVSLEGGRGLAIVHALSHGYIVLRHDNERVTACRVTISEKGSESVAPSDSRGRRDSLITPRRAQTQRFEAGRMPATGGEARLGACSPPDT